MYTRSAFDFLLRLSSSASPNTRHRRDVVQHRRHYTNLLSSCIREFEKFLLKSKSSRVNGILIRSTFTKTSPIPLTATILHAIISLDYVSIIVQFESYLPPLSLTWVYKKKLHVLQPFDKKSHWNTLPTIKKRNVGNKQIATI